MLLDRSHQREDDGEVPSEMIGRPDECADVKTHEKKKKKKKNMLPVVSCHVLCRIELCEGSDPWL